MRNFSISKLADIILVQRKKLHLTQQQLADKAGINRSMLCRLENQDYMPSLDQLTRLANTLKFDVTDVFIEYNPPVFHRVAPRNIVVYGAGSAGLSIATLLARQHKITLVDPLPERVELINQRSGPFEDEYVEKYFANANLHLTATLDGDDACKMADYAVIAVTAGYSAKSNYFDTANIENVIEDVLGINKNIVIVIRSNVPVGFTARIRSKYHSDNILVCPDFSCTSKALYDNLYPARIVVGCDETTHKEAQVFAGILKNCALKRDVEILLTGMDEAESIRLFSNTFLALRRSGFNELDLFAENKGLNTREIIKGVCLDLRIGNHDNNPSFGDEDRGLPEKLEQILADFESMPHFMLEAVTKFSENRMDRIADRVTQMAGIDSENDNEILSGDKRIIIGIYRLRNQNNTSSLRDKPIREIMERLRARGAGFIIYEPVLEDGTVFYGGKVVNHLKRFKKQSDVILADCYNSCLDDVREKVYTRDLSISNDADGNDTVE